MGNPLAEILANPIEILLVSGIAATYHALQFVSLPLSSWMGMGTLKELSGLIAGQNDGIAMGLARISANGLPIQVVWFCLSEGLKCFGHNGQYNRLATSLRCWRVVWRNL